jgi:small GTP-binding protein
LEIAAQGTEAIKNYLATFTDGRKLYEAKLIVVGEGAVGKTSIVNKLIESDFDIEQHADLIKSTEGVEVIPWFFDTANIQDFRVNIWDFGGQEIYHATHQFFLTKRSLYLFVWDARKEDRLGGFDYWLNIISLLSAASPVIVVLNKSDERIKEIDQAGLKEKFPNILCFLKVSALTGLGIGELSSQVKDFIVKLPHVGNDWPKAWAEIRYQLETDKRDYINYEQYLSLCSQFGLNQEQANFLGDYLHDLGVILHFRDDPILRDLVILKTGWGTDALYKIIDTKQIQNNKGRFRFSDLGNIWPHERYPAKTHIELLQLLIKFELCFKLMDSEEYIVPELLSPAKPEFIWDNSENLQFEYNYDFMPAGILTRFIVRNQTFISGDIYWRYGVVLENEGSVALVISEPLDRRIKILIRGYSNKEFLAIIRHEFDYIHQTLNNLRVKEMIPCTCKECKLKQPYMYDFWSLKKFSSKRIMSFPCPRSAENVLVAELLDGLSHEIVEILDIPKSPTQEIIMGNKYIFGNITGSNINIESMLEQVAQNVGSAPNVDEAEKKQLVELIEQLKVELQKATPTKKEETDAIAESAKALVEAGTKAQPNKTTIQITAEGLKKASKNIASVMPTVLTITTSIIKTVFQIAGIPLP